MFRRHPGKSESPDQRHPSKMPGTAYVSALQFCRAFVLFVSVWCQELGSRRQVPPGVEAMTWTYSPPSPSVSLILQWQTFEDFGGVKCTFFHGCLVGLHYVAAKSRLTYRGFWASHATACPFLFSRHLYYRLKRMHATVRYLKVIKYKNTQFSHRERAYKTEFTTEIVLPKPEGTVPKVVLIR